MQLSVYMHDALASFMMDNVQNIQTDAVRKFSGKPGNRILFERFYTALVDEAKKQDIDLPPLSLPPPGIAFP